MTAETKPWVENFVPGSTSVKIIAELEQVPELHRMGLPDFERWLENYRIEADIDRVNLPQLRDRIVFDANIVPSNKRDSRITMLGLVTDLMDYQRRTTPSS